MQLSSQFQEHSHIQDQIRLAAQDAANARITHSERLNMEAQARRGVSWAMKELGDYDD